MFRPTVLRTVARVAAAAAAPTTSRTFVSRASAPVLRFSKIPATAASWKVAAGVRAYSAAGGLTKEDAEGRIVTLLAGFDKVCFCSFAVSLEGNGGW